MKNKNVDKLGRTFGIELEFVSKLSAEAIIREARDKGIDLRATYYSDKSNQWRIKPDSSINSDREYYYSHELVTPICKTIGDLAKLNKLLKIIKPHSKVNWSTGYHIHWDVSDLGVDNFRKLLKLYMKYEQAVDGLLPHSRKNGNRYCKNVTQAWYQLPECFKTMNKQKTMSRLCSNTYFGERTYKLNTTNYFAYGTVEFRGHSGTLNIDKIVAWLCLTNAFINYAVNMRGAVVHDDDRADTYTTRQMINDFKKKSLLSKKTVAFLRKRHNVIKREVA